MLSVKNISWIMQKICFPYMAYLPSSQGIMVHYKRVNEMLMLPNTFWTKKKKIWNWTVSGQKGQFVLNIIIRGRIVSKWRKWCIRCLLKNSYLYIDLLHSIQGKRPDKVVRTCKPNIEEGGTGGSQTDGTPQPACVADMTSSIFSERLYSKC